MDVINFSGGGPQTDPLNDALIEAVRNVAAAGVVPVISAGNDRDDYGVGSAGSPGSAPDAISVAALSNSHVFAPALVGDRAGHAGAADADPVRADRRPDDSRGVGELGPAARRRRLDPRHERPAGATRPLRPAGEPRRRPEPASRRLAERLDRARLARHLHLRAQERPREGGRRRRHRRRRQPPRRGEPDPDPARRPRRDDRRPRRPAAARVPRRSRRPHDGPDRRRPARSGHRPRRRRHQLLLRRPDRVRASAEARRRRARRPDPLRDAAERRRPVRRLRRDEHGRAARRRRRGAAPAAPPELVAAAGQVGARLDGGAGVGRHGADGRGAGPDLRLRRGRPAGGERPEAVHRSGLALVLGPERQPRSRLEVAAARALRRRRRRRHLDDRGQGAGAAERRPDRRPRRGHDRSGRRARRSPSPPAPRPAPPPARRTASCCCAAAP